MPDDQDGRQSDLAVMDASEYDQKQRLKRIHDKFEAYQERKEEAWYLFVTGEISHQARCIQVLHAVQDAIDEIWELTEADRKEDHNQYWWNRNPGKREHVIGTIDFDHGEGIVFPDLLSILEAKDYYSESWRETETRRHGPDKRVTRERERVVPLDVSEEAFRRLRDYLSATHDMRLKFEELDNDSLPMIRGFDQSDEDGDGDEPENIEVEYNGDPDL